MARNRPSVRPADTATPARRARVVPTVFFLIWLAIPTLIGVFALRDFAHDLRTWRWDATPCTIVESRVEEREGRGGPGRAPDYALAVRYRYTPKSAGAGDVEAGGAREQTSSAYARGYWGGANYADAQRLALRYAPGSTATCYVNPRHPAEAVLKRNAPWKLLFLAIPALFIAIGLLGLYATWRPSPPKDAHAPAKPLSSTPAASNAGPWFAVVFFSLFLLIGLGVSAAMAGQAADYVTVGRWTPVPATVVASRLREHSGDNGTTYSADILYAYRVDGRDYRSNRYAVFGGSSGGRKGNRALIARHPPGARVMAYVNPADPTDAVIERRVTGEALLLLVPFVFCLIGGVGVFYSVRHLRRRLREARAENAPVQTAGATKRLFEPRGRGAFSPRVPAAPSARPVRTHAGGVELRPRQSPAVKLAVLTLFAAFWNGIVSVFVYQVVKGWASGRVEVCLSVFLVPFLAVGVGLIVGVCHTVLTLFNPRVKITLDAAELSLGSGAEIRWTFTGRYDRIHRLVVRLKGHEEATYRRGTSTHTDKNTFLASDVIDTTRPTEIYTGRGKVAVPPDTMHSFSAPNNKIVWTIELHGHIAGWPDVKEEYEIKVTPLPVEASVGGGEQEGDAEREGAWTRA